VVAALASVQQALAAHTPALQRACVATCTAHITLGVMHLATGELNLPVSAHGRQKCTQFRCCEHYARCCFAAVSTSRLAAVCCRGAPAGLL
jgi:hypothetical protein